MESYANRRAAQRETIVVRGEAVVEIHPRADHLAPAERISESCDQLPGELRLSRSDVDVIRNEPFAPVAEQQPTFCADDAIPEVMRDFGRTLPTRPADRTDVSAELPVQLGLEREVSCPRKDV